MSSRGQASKAWRGRGSERGNHRRGGRGRGRGGSYLGNSRHSTSSSASGTAPQYTPIERTDPLGPIVDSFDVNTLLVDIDNPIIEDVTYVASYNWVQGDYPHLLVPGSPPRWSPPAVDTKLQPDKREAYRDLNAARWSLHPLEPTIRSIKAMRPDFDLSTIDIVGCSHTISKILDILRGQAQSFRFDADVIGNTVLFTRKGASATEKIPVIGYGFRFPEVYTTWDTEVVGSVSHQRSINYMFGGLSMLVRSGVSGYLPAIPNAPWPAVNGRGDDSPAVADLEQSEDSASLRIEMKGAAVPQLVTFDMKTRSTYNQLDMSAMYPTLWLNQTSNFLAATHEYGLFKKPDVKDIRADVMKWEQENSSILARFHALLKLIIDSVRDADNPCEVSWNGEGDVIVTEQVGPGRRALPNELHASFTI